MKAAIKSILKGIERVTDICSEILTYNTYKRGYSLRESRSNVRRWSKDLRRFTKKIKASNRKYMEDVDKLKNNLDSSILQNEVYDFFMDVTTSLVLYVKKLTKSVKPFLLSLKDGRDYLQMDARAQRIDLLKSMRVFKTSIMLVMENFFRIIDRTKELETSVYNNRMAAAKNAATHQSTAPPPAAASAQALRTNLLL